MLIFGQNKEFLRKQNVSILEAVNRGNLLKPTRLVHISDKHQRYINFNPKTFALKNPNACHV